MIRLVLTLVIFVAFSGAARAGAVDDAEQCALKHEDSKIKIDDSAIDYCTKAIGSGDLSAEDLASTYFERGTKYAIKGDRDRAIDDFSQAIKLKPFFVKALMSRFVAYQMKGDKHLAIADVSQVIRLEPNNEEGFVSRGALFLIEGDLDLAIADFSEAIRISPDTSFVFFTRGNAYIRKGDVDLAIADFSQAIRLDPDSTPALHQRSVAYMIKGEFHLAIADANEVIRLAPNLTLGFIARGSAYLGKGEFDLAIDDWNRVILMTPDNAEAYINKAQALNAKAWNLATSANADERDGSEAVRLVLEALALYNAAEIRDTLAAAYAEAGRFDDAIAEQERAIEMLRTAGQHDVVAGAQGRLDLYRRRQPYRE